VTSRRPAIPAVSLRPAQPADRELLFRIYASTREEELAPVPWDPAAKEAFLRMQFDAQDRYYHDVFAEASYELIVIDGEVAGRIYVDGSGERVLLIDLALLPEHRGHGIGSALLEQVIAHADGAGKPIRIHVERVNRAQRLYARLGFRQIADEGVYLLLERPAYANTAS
jgi:ribosomal protein S18 acetylase RimI-like enzyme